MNFHDRTPKLTLVQTQEVEPGSPSDLFRDALYSSDVRDIDPGKMEPRYWLYGRHYLKGAVSCTVGDGGTGKTTLALTEAIAMATGRNLLGVTPMIVQELDGTQMRNRDGTAMHWDILYVNNEESRGEIERRVSAICLAHNIPLGDLNHLTILSGHDYPIVLAWMEGSTIFTNVELARNLAATEFDAIIFDPFVSCHRVPENNNAAIDCVIKLLAQIASGNSHNTKAIELIHHSRKAANGDSTTRRVADARGASAFIDGVRAARTLNKMTPAEAARAGIREEQRWRYIRLDSGKANYAGAGEDAMWYQLKSVVLANGDDVGVIAPWRFPAATDDVTEVHRERVQEMARIGSYRVDVRSADWIGRAVAEVLDLDADRKRIKLILKNWFDSGALTTKERTGPNRMVRTFVTAGGINEGASVSQ
jgi:hypothetical protein